MLRRGFFLVLITVLLSALPAKALPDRKTDTELNDRIANYQTWKQVNRFDLNVTDASFKIENSLPFGGG